MQTLIQENIAQTLVLIAVLSSVPLITSMIIGFLVSVLQAVSQIQEQSLSFVPRILAVTLTGYFAWPFLGRELLTFSEQILQGVQHIAAAR